MKINIINNCCKGIMKSLLFGGLVGVALTSCSDWDDHYDASTTEGSNISLWDEIQQHPELSDFAEVLSNTKVFRQHKKSATSYADILMGGQSLTIMAPVNGTFNKDSLLKEVQTAKGDSAVERFFVMNHITRSPRSAVDSRFRTLNNKWNTITPTAINNVAIKDANLHCKNGILHILSSQLPYNHTIYETLTQFSQFNSIGARVSHYNQDIFDENASVSSGLVDGIPVYVDSVLYEDNKLVNAIGLINSEDSTYWVALPTNEGWNKAWEEAHTYFAYPTSLEKADSLQDYWTARALLEDAVFSKTIQGHPEDSVITKNYNKATPEYHRFYRPFDANGIFGSAKGQQECSNGIIYYHDEWPFTPEQTYFKKIEQEAEETWNITDDSLCTYTSRALNADSISKGKYLFIKGNSGTANWKVSYKINNTLSGKYDVCVVTLPQTIEDPNASVLPYKYKVRIHYIDENGNSRTDDLGGKEFITDASKVDTMVVADGFKFPACNYNQQNEKITVDVICSITSRQNKQYTRDMFLDAIFLRPKK